MPLFFYDFFDGDEWSQDEVGLEFASTEQALIEAIAGARGLWMELIDERRDPRACAFDVRGKDGRSLFRFDFAELLGANALPPVRDLEPGPPAGEWCERPRP